MLVSQSSSSYLSCMDSRAPSRGFCKGMSVRLAVSGEPTCFTRKFDECLQGSPQEERNGRALVIYTFVVAEQELVDLGFDKAPLSLCL